MAIDARTITTIVAVRYLDAAKILHKNSPNLNALWEPLNHLFAMSAELALKAFLEGSGVSEKDLKQSNIRHSLNALLILAVQKGLRTSYDVADVLIEMNEAHALHAYRYIPRPEEGEFATVYSAHPAAAFAAIQRLLDQCAIDPFELRKQTMFPDNWPHPSLPVHPVTAEQLEGWIAEKKSLREWSRTLKTTGY